MNKEQFWLLIAEYQQSDDLDWLTETLVTHSVDDIAKFEIYFQEAMAQAYTSELWGAAHTILGGCSDNSFEFFRGWLISQGHTFFETAVKDPEALATLISTDYEEAGLIPEFEDILDMGLDAFTLKLTGDTEWDDDIHDQFDKIMEKHGFEHRYININLDWEEDDLPTRYPKLWARFGENPLL